MPPDHGQPGLFRPQPLDPPDRLEEAARLHFQDLVEHVFGRLQIELGGTDPNAPHGLAVTQLHWIAASGPEPQKSVCLGVIYALLTLEWNSPACQGYWDYLAVLRTLDDHDITVRTMLALARRCHALRAPCRSQLLVTLGDMAEARWPELERVVLALQRELHPGARWSGSFDALAALLRLAVRCSKWLAADDVAAQLSFLWAARWIGALQEGFEGQSDGMRRSALELAGALWEQAPQQVLQAGPVMTWALLHCRAEPHLAEAWRHASKREDLFRQTMPQACLDHLLGVEEQEHLAFLVAAERQEERYFQWFVDRHLSAILGSGEAAGGSVHFADVALCALAAAEGVGCKRPDLWSRFWELAGAQGRLAFIFAACRPGYGRDALLAVLAADPNPAQACRAVQQLARGALPPAAVVELQRLLGVEY